MALLTSPAFVGQVVITAGINDDIEFTESISGVTNATIAAGTYYHGSSGTAGSLGAAIKTAMDAVATNVYTVTFTVSTCKYTILRASGAETFFLMYSLTEATRALTGGDADTPGDALTADQYNPGLTLGWDINAAATYDTTGTTFTADRLAGACWLPVYPPHEDSVILGQGSSNFRNTSAQAFAIDGTATTYNFSSFSFDKDEFPISNGTKGTRKLNFKYETDATAIVFVGSFWLPWAAQGESFRYYPDKTASTYFQYKLMGESLKTQPLNGRLNNNAWWQGSLEMHRS